MGYFYCRSADILVKYPSDDGKYEIVIGNPNSSFQAVDLAYEDEYKSRKTIYSISRIVFYPAVTIELLFVK